MHVPQKPILTPEKGPATGHPAAVRRMQLRYGFNEIDAWWLISVGEHREEIRRHLRRMGTQVIRIFVFDKPVPDPVCDWRHFAGYVQAVLDAGAVPMVTFAKFHPPYQGRNLRTFSDRCADVVWGCLEQWGPEAVSDWYWCIWNEPNNALIGGGLTIDEYLPIYREVAGRVHELLKPYLGGRKARIGGPAVEGFQPFWLDWIARLVGEVDDALVGFVSWHKYADWRPVVPSAMLGVDLSGMPEAPIGQPYDQLLMAQTPDYEARARAVSRVLAGRDILNVCGEHNGVVHHDHAYVGGLNQNAFGAAYYASCLIHLLRGGAELEMRWTATSNDDAYGLLTPKGEPTAACSAKELFAQHVRYGDYVRLPGPRPDIQDVDAVVAWADDGRRSAVFVHTKRGPRVLTVADWDPTLKDSRIVLSVDGSTAHKINGTVRWHGSPGRLRSGGSNQ